MLDWSIIFAAGVAAVKKANQAFAVPSHATFAPTPSDLSLFEGIPVGLYRATPDGLILDVNPCFLRMLGYPNRNALTAVNAASLYVDPRARQHWLTLVERQGVVSGFESEIRRHDGTTIWVRAEARAVRDASGQTLYVEGVIVDITERNLAEEQTRQRVAELEGFYDLSKRLRKARNPEEMYPILLGHALRLLQADQGTLALLNLDRQAFRRVYTVGAAAEAQGSTFPVAGTPSGQVVASGAAFVTADFARTARPARTEATSRHRLGPVVIVPVSSEQDIIGTLGVGRAKRIGQRPFTDGEVRLLEGIAEMGGTAIRRARLHQNLQQAYLQTVLALAQTIESHDSSTANHCKRITRIAARVAREMGCSDELIQDVRWGARLHDIGKIGVPDAILHKPEALTEAEWRMMREHPVLGEEILGSVEGMRGAAMLIRHHQEKWDGTGYPDGLRGEQIPVGARILAVVDAYGAITEARPYKPAKDHAEAVAEIRKCAGTQFDPRVVDAFCRVIEDACPSS